MLVNSNTASASEVLAGAAGYGSSTAAHTQHTAALL
jgi:hypothetical protein